MASINHNFAYIYVSVVNNASQCHCYFAGFMLRHLLHIYLDFSCKHSVYLDCSVDIISQSRPSGSSHLQDPQSVQVDSHLSLSVSVFELTTCNTDNTRPRLAPRWWAVGTVLKSLPDTIHFPRPYNPYWCLQVSLHLRDPGEPTVTLAFLRQSFLFSRLPESRKNCYDDKEAGKVCLR